MDSPLQAAVPAERAFTPDELKQFDGKEGRPAYVAYKGLVYDVTGSKLWRNGVHVRQHNAGEDLTAAMPAAPHDEHVMERWPVVGRIAEPEVVVHVPLLYRLSMDKHLHPIVVHFPIAQGMLAPVFALASLLFVGRPLYAMLQVVAFWQLVVCTLAVIPSVLTGVISWYYNHRAKMNTIYWVKWIGSGTLALLCSAALLVWKFGLGMALPPAEPGGLAFWAYTLLLCLIAANVAVLGHYGGKIVYPH